MPENSPPSLAIDAITAINAAIRSLRLYPAGSAIIANSLAKVNQIASDLFARSEQVVFAEAEKVLIVDDQPMTEKTLQKPQIRAFLETMLDLGIRTLSLHRGLDPYELRVLLEILSRGTDEINAAGGLATLVKRRQLTHIRIDEKRFVALDKGQRIAPIQAPDEDGPAMEAPQTGTGDAPGDGGQGATRVLYSGMQPFADLAQGEQSTQTQAVFDQLLSDLAGLNAAGPDSVAPPGPAVIGLDVENLVSILGQHFAREPDKSSPAVESLFAHLKAVVQTHLRSRRFKAADRILEALGNAAANSACPDGMRNLVRTLVEAIAEEALLDGLVQSHREGDPDTQQILVRILRRLIPASSDFMLARLRISEVIGERSHLMRLLPELGNALRPAVLQHIESGGPWYYLRNLAGLLGKIGAPEDLPVIESLLGHPDPRVQREAVGSLFAIEDERRGDILLRFLPQANDSLKLTIVTLLGVLSYRPAAAALIGLLESWAPRYAKTEEALAEKICAALGRIGDPAAVAVLSRMIEPRGLFARNPGKQVENTARQALAQIRENPQPTHQAIAPSPAAQMPSAADAAMIKADPRNPSPTGPATTKAEVDRLAAGDDTETAVERLLAMIRAEAKAKRFIEAEQLREKLYEIDALALGPIIQAGEIIEAEKSRAIDPDHVQIFAPLYAQLTETERNGLYHAMTPENFDSGDTLVHQGRINDRLYFINQGAVKIVHRQGAREMLIDRPAAGSLVGGDSFFKATVATVAVLALGPVAATRITRDGLEALYPDHPGLKSKLPDYVARLDTTAELLRRRGMDRRRHPRYKIQGRIKFQIQDRQGRPLGRPFLGTLADCSIGGISFCIGSSKSETARILLGRRLQLAFVIPLPGAPCKVSTWGTVIGVNDLMANEHSLHIRFERNLDPSIAEALAQTAL